eukprot:TRINITY_DN55243_c0_g1_i1.p1 TRINITY_DN55243_c0_g1~~TRINITY_DN55243_c0_g1_i1.p1  ORF type:complete len:829 (-),score=73.82 TRINITY_DN55243_c0_g1_i1:80-2533(-)
MRAVAAVTSAREGGWLVGCGGIAESGVHAGSHDDCSAAAIADRFARLVDRSPTSAAIRCGCGDAACAHCRAYQTCAFAKHQARRQPAQTACSIESYVGGVVYHPTIRGIVMRSGVGTQLWPDGRVYAGQWANHVYHGEGSLWRCLQDYRCGQSHAVYRGQWFRGRRHGHGCFRFRQVSRQDCLTWKVYDGEFQHDVFCGYGSLLVEDTTPEPPVARSELSPLELQTWTMSSCEGSFRCDMKTAFKELEHGRPDWIEKHPHAREELHLEELTEEDACTRNDVFCCYFGHSRNGHIQQAGVPMADLATAYFTLEGKDTHVLTGEGKMSFNNGGVYVGGLLDGLPHGAGELVQRRRRREDGDPEEYARYTGEWSQGERHGAGKYSVSNRVSYDGSWQDDRRHGHGEQVVPYHLQESYGYTRYRGEWHRDLKHGQGQAFRSGMSSVGDNAGLGAGVLLPRLTPAPSRATKEATEGCGPVILDETLLYVGKWREGVVRATDDEPAWIRHVAGEDPRGRYYFGALSLDGLRAGRMGYLYAASAEDDAGFRAAVAAGAPFVENQATLALPANHGEGAAFVKDPHLFKHTLYIGGWKHNVPCGTGIQHFPGCGVYYGQFNEGLRHGRGTWMTLDGCMTYRAAEGHEGSSFDNDQLHGVADVEDAAGVHRSVVYRHGMCQTWRPGLSEVKTVSRIVVLPVMQFYDPILALLAKPEATQPSSAAKSAVAARRLRSAGATHRGVEQIAAAETTADVTATSCVLVPRSGCPASLAGDPPVVDVRATANVCGGISSGGLFPKTPRRFTDFSSRRKTPMCSAKASIASVQQ